MVKLHTLQKGEAGNILTHNLTHNGVTFNALVQKLMGKVYYHEDDKVGTPDPRYSVMSTDFRNPFYMVLKDVEELHELFDEVPK